MAEAGFRPHQLCSCFCLVLSSSCLVQFHTKCPVMAVEQGWGTASINFWKSRKRCIFQENASEGPVSPALPPHIESCVGRDWTGHFWALPRPLGDDTLSPGRSQGEMGRQALIGTLRKWGGHPSPFKSLARHESHLGQPPQRIYWLEGRRPKIGRVSERSQHWLWPAKALPAVGQRDQAEWPLAFLFYYSY